MRSKQQLIEVVGAANRRKDFRWTLATQRFKEFILPRQDQEPSINAISEGIQVPRRTAIRAIKSLERVGYLYVHRRRLQRNFNATNHYKWLGEGSDSNAVGGSAKVAPKEVFIIPNLTSGAAAPHPAPETPLRSKSQNPEGVGFSGGVGAAAPAKALDRIESIEVGSKKSQREGARGGARQSREPKPPTTEELLVIEHFQLRMRERMGVPVPIVTATDLRALRRFRFLYREDDTVTTDKIIHCIDIACAIETFPFYKRMFSLREFLQVDPLQKFGVAEVSSVSPSDASGTADRWKKSVAQIVADRGTNYFFEVERISRLSWRTNRDDKISLLLVRKGLNDFEEYTRWGLRDTEVSEVDYHFVRILSEIYTEFRDNAGRDPIPESLILPGNLMSKVIDRCINERIPFPPSFVKHRDRVRDDERKMSSESLKYFLEEDLAATIDFQNYYADRLTLMKQVFATLRVNGTLVVEPNCFGTPR
jgi:hypothetical protein